MSGNNPSRDLLDRLLQHGHQNLQTNNSLESVSRLGPVPSCDGTNSSITSARIPNLSNLEKKSLPKQSMKMSSDEKTKGNSSSNISHHKKYRIRF